MNQHQIVDQVEAEWKDRLKAVVETERKLLKELKELRALNQELLDALLHLHHNAKHSGADMGLAFDVAEAAIKKASGW